MRPANSKIIHNHLGYAEDGGNNVWDDGYPSGGNHWAYDSGVDWFSGPYQNETGSDGIVDKPHVSNGIIDRYPLIMPRTSTPTPPVAKIFPAVPSIRSLAPALILFNASLSLVGWNGTHYMPITEYRWNFGDGNTTSTAAPHNNSYLRIRRSIQHNIDCF